MTVFGAAPKGLQRTKDWARAVAGALTLVLPASLAFAQSGASGDADTVFKLLRSEVGPGLRADWNFDTGRPRFIFGQAIDLFGAPQTDAEHEAVARRFIDSYEGLFGFGSNVLVTDQVKRLEMQSIGTTDKTAVLFSQWVAGLPVRGGTVAFLFNFDGKIVGIENNGLPDVDQVDVVPNLDEGEATRRADAAFGQANAKLLGIEVAIVADASGHAPVLAWVVDLRAGRDVDGLPQQRRFFVDAHSGEIFRSENTVHTFTDLLGNTSQWATPGVKPDTGANPPKKIPSWWVLHTSAVGSANTASNGDYTIPYGGASIQAVTASFSSSSKYAWVSNVAGGDYSKGRNLTPGVRGTLELNKNVSQFRTAQVNAQTHGVVFREWIRALDPADNVMEFRQRLNVNINSSCNAYYDGSSTNYYRASGGCANTAYTTVVAHETGHWANDKYGEGNGGDGYGEGAADVWAEYIYDTPIVGEDFCGTGCHVRDGRNGRQYCGSCGSGCYGEVHADGEVLMGALWKVRDRLNVSLGDAAGDLVADSLWLRLKQTYNDKTICQVIDDHLLTLDDNDGNLANGTPHSNDIDKGFKDQGFPGHY